MLNLSPLQQSIVADIQGICGRLGYRLYAVGGIVRDWLLGRGETPTDIDLVVVGETNCAIAVARELRRKYQTRYVEHPKFQTAELRWDAFTLDLTTARQEYYPSAGANPVVSASTLEHDLWRRDFTINALAVEILPQGQISPVIDLFGGLGDLAEGWCALFMPTVSTKTPEEYFGQCALPSGWDLACPQRYGQKLLNCATVGCTIALGESPARGTALHFG